jgi:hypothetical protein
MNTMVTIVKGAVKHVIQSVVGWSLTAAVLSFQVLTDRKAAWNEDVKKLAR